MSKDFKFFKSDLDFWRKSTSDLDKKSSLDEYDDFAEEDNSSDEMEISLSAEEVLKFRSKEKTKDFTAFEELNVNSNAGVDGNTYSKFKNGKMNIDATLDLHGMTENQAFITLKNLIDSSFKNDKRCLLVITGKGLFSGGILRKSLPKWINSPDLRPKVISISTAMKKDGGEGAFYILIKRKK